MNLKDSYALPSVTVAICNYNQSSFISRALSSALSQSYPNIDLIIVDDYSTDDSVAVIENLIRDLHKKPTFISRSSNGGQLTAMMDALDITRAPFMMWLDADDWLPSDAVETHIAFHLNGLRNCAFTCSNMAVVNSEDQLISSAFTSLADDALYRDKNPLESIIPRPVNHRNQEGIFLKKTYRHWAWSATSAMMFRTSVIRLIKPDDTSKIRICADNYLARFSHIIGGSIIIPSILAYYRIHNNNNFTKHDILGDRASNSGEHKSLIDEMNFQFARVLQDRPEIITNCIRSSDLYKLIINIGTTKAAFDRLLENKTIIRKLKMRRRCALALRRMKFR